LRPCVRLADCGEIRYVGVSTWRYQCDQILTVRFAGAVVRTFLAPDVPSCSSIASFTFVVPQVPPGSYLVTLQGDCYAAPVEPVPEPCTESATFTVTGTQASAAITTDKPTYTIGDPIQVCYTVSQRGHVRITSTLPDGQVRVLREGSENGTGGCFPATAGPPPGARTVRLELYGLDDEGMLATAATTFTVTGPTPVGTPPTGTVPPPTNPPSPSATPTVTPTPVGTPTPPPPSGQCTETDKFEHPADKDEVLAVVIVHGWRGGDWSLAPITQRITQRIDQRIPTDPKVKLFVLDWQRAAAVFGGSGAFNLRGPGPRTDEAIRVGNCLAAELAGYSRVHFIAHSLGSWVIDTAADQLTPKGVRTHLTFLDAYSPAESEIGKLGDRATHAEHFVSRPVHGLAPLTNWQLPEAHNFNVTNPRDEIARFSILTPPTSWPGQIAANFLEEHGWPIEWYAASGSPGITQSWEFGGSPGSRTDGELTCLRTPRICRSGDAARVSTADLVVAAQVGSVTKDTNGVKVTSASPASATIRLPEGANWAAVELSVSFQGTGAGTVDVSFAGADPVRLEVGPDGFVGTAHVFLPTGTSRDVTIRVDAQAPGQIVATVSSIQYGVLASGDAPGAPNTGSGARPTSASSPLMSAFAAAVFSLALAFAWGVRRKA
jgi:hypothetical protein